MKRMISLLLATVMAFSMMPLFASAEDAVVEPEVIEQQTDLTAQEEQYIGNTVTLGNDMYTLQDGEVYVSKNYGRDTKLADGEITWLVEDNGFVYWSKLGEYNTTDIVKYDPATGEQTKMAHLFVPVEAFDAAGDDVYYLYNGEIDKINVSTNEESFVMIDKTITGFYLDGEERINAFYYNGQLDCSLNNGVNDYAGEQVQTFSSVTDSMKVVWVGEMTKEGGQYFYSKNLLSCEIPTYTLDKERKLMIPKAVVTFQNGDSKLEIAVLAYKSKKTDEIWYYLPSANDGGLFGFDVIVDSGNVGCALSSSFMKKSDFEKVFSTKKSSNVRYDKLGTFTTTGGGMITGQDYSCYQCDYATIKDNKGKVIDVGTCRKCGHKYNYNGHLNSGIGGMYTLNNPDIKTVLREEPYQDSPAIKSGKVERYYITGYATNAYGKKWYRVSQYENILGFMTKKNGWVYSDKIDAYYTAPQVYETQALTYQDGRFINQSSQAVISPVSYPTGNILKKSFNLTGTISSGYNITYAKAEVIDVNTENVVLRAEYYPSKKGNSLNIGTSNLNYGLKFEKLNYGTYYLKYTVDDDSQFQSQTWISPSYFSVVADKNASPTPMVAAQSIENGKLVTISCDDNAAVIHYTVNDGAEQTGYGNVSFKLTTAGNHTIKSWTTRSGKNQSYVVTKTVSVERAETPRISDVKYTMDQAWVTISGSGSIKYTTNGAVPNSNSTTYDNTIFFDKNSNSFTLKAISTQYGYQNSVVAEKYIDLSVPEAVDVSLFHTKAKIAQGKTATVCWDASARAAGYVASLYHEGTWVKDYITEGTAASFALPETGSYTIKVRARNFKGDSAESNVVTVESMAPVTVTFVDEIIRDNVNVTDDVIATVQERVNQKKIEMKEEPIELEGNAIAVQTIDYDSKPQRPMTPSKEGFTFAGYEGIELPATENKTVKVLYEINYYTVEFWNKYEGVNEQIGATQEIMYTYSAEAPEHFTYPDGFALGGWNIDRNFSEGTDFTYVDGNMKLYASYTWKNKNLPAIVQIIHAEKDEETSAAYNVDLKFINNNFKDTQARAIVSLYTSDGRMVYTQTEDLVMGDFKIGATITKQIQLAYKYKVSKISAVLVQVTNGKTGGAVSEMVWEENIEFPNKDAYYWGPWSDWTPTEYTGSATRQVENDKMEYRYQRMETRDSDITDHLDGWTWSGSTEHPKGEKSNGGTYIANENTPVLKRTVRTINYPASERKIYNYWGYKKTTSPVRYHFCWCYYDNDVKIESGWRDSTLPFTSFRTQVCWCGNEQTGYYYDSSNGHYYYHVEEGKASNNDGWTEYLYTDTTYTHHFYKWFDWSPWSSTQYVQSDRQNVESRRLYRYRDLYPVYPEYDPSKDNSSEEKGIALYPIQGNISGLDKDYAGKKATVLVYKKTNTDPTEEQLEYVNQIKLGSNNSYDFVVNPKDELDYLNTSDFIVTLSIEGCDKLVDIEVIKAPIPKHTVVFYDSEGVQIGEPVLVEDGSGIDANTISAPEKSGYRFVKWDKSLVNITRDMAVNAIYEKKAYPVVFVDYENQTTELAEVYYGDSMMLPEVQPIVGKKFVGWDIEYEKYIADGESVPERFNVKEEKPYYLTTENTYILVEAYDSEIHNIVDQTEYYKYFSEQSIEVTESRIVTAVWEAEKYTVKFYDFNGNVVNEQKVCYGESAILPQGVEDGGKVYSWDVTGDEWWNVTRAMNVYPYIPQTVYVDAPMIDADTKDIGGMFYASLDTIGSEEKIYYSVSSVITERDARDFVLNLVAEDITENGSTVQLLSSSEEFSDGVTSDSAIKEYTEQIQINEGTIVYAFAVDAEGNISTISVFEFGYHENDGQELEDTYVVEPDCPAITIPSTSANPGETVTIPVEIKNSPGLTNLSLLLGYDAEKTSLDYIENGNVFEDGEFTYDVRDDGSCKFQWSSYDENKTDGILMNLTFTVGSNVIENDLDLDIMIDYNDETTEGERQIVTVPGAITTEDTITGLLGDVNGDEEVDFADAIQILKFDAGLSDFEEKQFVLGDVNGDEEVDFADAIQVLRFDAGLIEEFVR